MPEEQYMHKDIQDIHSKDGRAPVRDFGQFPGQAVLELDNVSRSFNKGAVQAVRDVSFKLHPGEVLGLIGVNGAGKTTTVKMCSTLLDPTSGQIHVAGIDPRRKSLPPRGTRSKSPDSKSRMNTAYRGAVFFTILFHALFSSRMASLNFLKDLLHIR